MSSYLNQSSFKQCENGINITTSAPGKVILTGEHSVVYNKLAVAVGLDLRTTVHLYEIDAGIDNVLVLKLESFNFEYVFKLEDLQILLSHKPQLNQDGATLSQFNWSHPEYINHKSTFVTLEPLIDGILKKNTPDLVNTRIIKCIKCLFYLLSCIFSSTQCTLTSICIAVESELEIGAGLGSSASFSVSLVAACIQYLKIKTINLKNISKSEFNPFKWDDKINFEHFNAFQLSCISEWAFGAETIFHGTPSGIDNTVCTYGNLIQFRRGTKPITMKLINSFNVLLINTKVDRETAKLVTQTAQLRNTFPKLIDYILDSMDNLTHNVIDVIESINKAETQHDSNSLNENYDKLTTLININHQLLNALNVSHPKLEQIIGILKEHGLKGKLTGAGGGGFAICILPPSIDSDAVIKHLLQYNFGVIKTKVGSPGVQIH